MIVADTSIWIDHLRSSNPHMKMLLNDAAILQHRFIVSELAVGNLPDRDNTLSMLLGMRCVPIVSESDFYQFMEREPVAGTGLGFVDINLLASLARYPGVRLWTKDKRLNEHAVRMRFSYYVD